mgnify:CR=1 FL=1
MSYTLEQFAADCREALKADPGETTDLAQQEPDRLAKLSATLKKLYAEIREESPVWPAWEWTRYEQQHIEWPDYWVNRKGVE